MTENNGSIGSSFDDLLAEQGLLEACEQQAIKELLALQVGEAMREQGLTKTEMARRMGTSRAALDRLLEARDGAVTLQTMQKAAAAVGRRLRLELA